MGRGFAVFEVGPPGTDVVDARRDYFMQPAQDLRSFFLRASAEGRERALSRRNGSPCILPIGQRYATDHLGGRRIDEVHHLAAVGFNVELSIMIVSLFMVAFIAFSPCMRISVRTK
jgi:hypothetical protein